MTSSSSHRQHRAAYLAAAIIVIAAGLFVRRQSAWCSDLVNLYLGDMLYAVAMFLAIGIIAPALPTLWRVAIALLACFAIELSQLYQADWINAVRRTLPGRLLLGSGFLWSDLLAYALGVAFAGRIDYRYRENVGVRPK